MLSIPSTQSSPQDAVRLKKAFVIVFCFTLFLWGHRINKDFIQASICSSQGVLPQQFTGLIGVFTAPLIHGSYLHLISNTPAILILGTALLYGYPRFMAGSQLLAYMVNSRTWGYGSLHVPFYHFGASGTDLWCDGFYFRNWKYYVVIDQRSHYHYQFFSYMAR